MRLGHMKPNFLILLLVLSGCASPFNEHNSHREPSPVPRHSTIPGVLKANAQKEALQQITTAWEKSIDGVVQSLKCDLEKNKFLTERALAFEEHYAISQQNKLLFSCINDLMRIRDLQGQLNKRDTAFSREIIYQALIDNYLSILKYLETEKDENVFPETSAAEIKEELKASYDKNNFNAVIDLYNRLIKMKPEEEKDSESRAYYVLSLAQLGKKEEAIHVAETTLYGEFYITCENVPLFYTLGEWLIERERYGVAETVFESIINYYQFEEKWTKKAQTKLSLLKNLRSPEVLKPKEKPVTFPLEQEENLNIVDTDSPVSKEKVREDDALEQQKLETANILLDKENYEEALSLLDQLQLGRYADEARSKKDIAIDRLSRQRRVKAGQLFWQAKQTEDAELRTRYLTESYRLLKEIMDHYPHNRYAEKIRRNLEDVRSELEKINPEFFTLK